MTNKSTARKMTRLDRIEAIIAAKKVTYVPLTESRAKQYSASVLRPGNHSANHKPAITAAEARQFATETRQALRAESFAYEMRAITDRYPAEPRARRRQLARDIAKNKLHAAAVRG